MAAKKLGLHITYKHTGKMLHMQSLSTNCNTNPYCILHRKVKGSICAKCYACAQTKRWKSMQEPLERNSELLNGAVLDNDLIPTINASLFRFESFGDIGSGTHVINLFNICKANPKTEFALWTKNPWLIDAAIKQGHAKPDNLVIIQSSMFINKRDMPKYDFIDKTFTVYDKNTDVEINCGARSCITCQKCYHKNGIDDIRELLK